jgi:mRNA interferase RelE/StbE
MDNFYTAEFTLSAAKEFKLLPENIRGKTLEVIHFLSVNPYSEFLKVKKIKGHNSLYRIRISDYRLVYEVKNKTLLIIVIKIGHRKEVYQKLKRS